MICDTISAPADTGKGSPILLRPHHLLCLQNFRGKGYSPAFVRRMTKIHALVSGKNAASDETRQYPAEDFIPEPSAEESGSPPVENLIPDPSAGTAERHPILLVSGKDTLCAACPHCGGAGCTSTNPSRFDALVLARTGLRIGQILEEGMASPELPAMNPDLLQTCCPGCKWFQICMQICRE